MSFLLVLLADRADRSSGAPADPSAVAPTETYTPLVHLPDDFGFELFPFQDSGVHEIVNSDRWLLADEQGLGKTITGLGVAKLIEARHTLVITRPVVLTAWREACEMAGLGDVATIRTGRKMPKFPETGVIIVPCSTAAKHAAAILQWGPDLVIVDEAHDYKSPKAARSKAVRALCAQVRRNGGKTLAMTGTPFTTDPMDVLGVLALTRHLEDDFGGEAGFIRSHGHWADMPWGKVLEFNRASYGALNKKLDDKVWIRRLKADVQKDLPAKRKLEFVLDLDGAGQTALRKALDELEEEVYAQAELAVGNGDAKDLQAALNRISPMTLSGLLRKATGRAKAGACVTWINEWLERNPGESLVVWAHHREVIAELLAGIPGSKGLLGGLTDKKRGQLVAEFQAGQTRVLVCGITAAGVGITLTKSATSVIVEPPWNATELAQAEDRIHRIGQTRVAEIICLWAADTFDDNARVILTNKAQAHAQLGGGGVSQIVVPHAWKSALVRSITGKAVRRRDKFAA